MKSHHHPLYLIITLFIYLHYHLSLAFVIIASTPLLSDNDFYEPSTSDLSSSFQGDDYSSESPPISVSLPQTQAAGPKASASSKAYLIESSDPEVLLFPPQLLNEESHFEISPVFKFGLVLLVVIVFGAVWWYVLRQISLDEERKRKEEEEEEERAKAQAQQEELSQDESQTILYSESGFVSVSDSGNVLI